MSDTQPVQPTPQPAPSPAAPAIKPVPVWKRVVAVILDLFTAFFLFGNLIARFTGGISEKGFRLEGWPALLLFVLIGVYFFVGRRYAGGTLWDRVLGIARPQPR